MLLVHPKKGRPGTFEVAWTWVPFFIAADSGLIESVDEEMKTRFGGREMLAYGVVELMLEMHEAIIDMVCEKYPIKGLRQYLEAICEVSPEKAPGQ